MARRSLAVAALLGAAFSLQSCVIIPISWPSAPEMNEVVYRKGAGIRPSKIAILDVSGVLRAGGAGDGLFSSDSSVVDLTRKLDVVKKDSAVDAVILRIDSPGGGVTASDIMYHELEKFREEEDIPVYVSMQTVAASGGYYIAMAADKVYATPTSITGSIGVIAAFPEARGLMDKIGFDMNAVTSGANKDAGAFYKDMTPEDRALYQAVVDDMYGKFVAVVDEGRDSLDEARVRELADGRIYTADQALEAGLIDGVAYLDEVIEAIEDEQGLGKSRVVIIKRSGSDTTTSLYANARGQQAAPEASRDINLFNVDLHAWQQPTNEFFNYMWIP